MHFWDWKSGYNFQRLQSAVQPGSIDSESGIFASIFDKSSCRLITCEADKTIKIYKEDETAVRRIFYCIHEIVVCFGFRFNFLYTQLAMWVLHVTQICRMLTFVDVGSGWLPSVYCIHRRPFCFSSRKAERNDVICRLPRSLWLSSFTIEHTVHQIGICLSDFQTNYHISLGTFAIIVRAVLCL